MVPGAPPIGGECTGCPGHEEGGLQDTGEPGSLDASDLGLGALDPREAEFAEHLLAAEELHSQKGEDDNEQEKEEQQADDRFHGVEKRDDQVPERCPVPANRGRVGEGGQAGPAEPTSQWAAGGSTLVPFPATAGMPGNSKDLLCDFENTQ